jgi:hypothetical protein
MLIAFAFVNSLMAAWAVSFAMGVAIPWWTNLVRTTLQLPTSEEMRGRVMAMFAIASQTLLLGWVVGGVTSELVGPKATLISAGVSMALFYVFVWTKSSAIRQLGRE